MIVRALSGKLLNILGEIINGVSARRPRRNNKLEFGRSHFAGNNVNAKHVRRGAINVHSVGKIERRRGGCVGVPQTLHLLRDEDDEQQQESMEKR